jgi:5-(carboxyamino)imidazole ribonucleotide mutase
MTDRVLVGIVMGSESDRETMEKTCGVLDEYGISWELSVMSAHRTPEKVAEYSRSAAGRGIKIIIAAAGLAAHLAGAVAANTKLPVIGVPIQGGPLNGFDALLSTVMMPRGVPVATVAIGSHGAANAGHLAVRILALFEKDVAERMG